MSELIAAIKIGKEKNINKLYELGQVHFRPTKYFREIEDINQPQYFRKDKYEGTSSILKKGRLELFKDGAKLAYSEKPELLIRGENDEGYIFCFRSIFENQVIIGSRNKLPIDEKIKNFGDTALIIFNPKEFMSRLTNCLYTKFNNFKYHQVTYLKIEEQNYLYSIFCKPHHYEYQNEGRIFINKIESEEYINTEIGNLSDIAIKLPIDKLNDIELEYDKNPVDNKQ